MARNCKDLPKYDVIDKDGNEIGTQGFHRFDSTNFKIYCDDRYQKE